MLRPLSAFEDVADDREQFEQAGRGGGGGLVPTMNVAASKLADDVGERT